MPGAGRLQDRKDSQPGTNHSCCSLGFLSALFIHHGIANVWCSVRVSAVLTAGGDPIGDNEASTGISDGPFAHNKG